MVSAYIIYWMEIVLISGVCLYYLSLESFVLQKVQIEIIRLQTLIIYNLKFSNC